MKRALVSSVLFLLSMTLLTGILYPLAVTGVSAIIASEERRGSIINHRGASVGSALVGQLWTSPKYFHGRPSAINCAPLPSGGSNLSVSSKEFRAKVTAQRDSMAARFNVAKEQIPAELLMASSSGIDPHISQEAALLQVDRIMTERGWPLSKRDVVYSLIQKHTTTPVFGILGKPYVNVLLLNLSLDDLGAL